MHILVTHIVGEALGVIRGKSEDEIKDMCLETLCRIFRRKVSSYIYIFNISCTAMQTQIYKFTAYSA